MLTYAWQCRRACFARVVLQLTTFSDHTDQKRQSNTGKSNEITRNVDLPATVP